MNDEEGYSQPRFTVKECRLEDDLAFYGETRDKLLRLAKNTDLPYLTVLRGRLQARRSGTQQERLSRI